MFSVFSRWFSVVTAIFSVRYLVRGENASESESVMLSQTFADLKENSGGSPNSSTQVYDAIPC